MYLFVHLSVVGFQLQHWDDTNVSVAFEDAQVIPPGGMMAGNGWKLLLKKWLEMAGIGWNGWKLLEWLEMA